MACIHTGQAGLPEGVVMAKRFSGVVNVDITRSVPDWAPYTHLTDEDPSECHDLAAQEPEKLQELIQLWWAQAGQYQALPLLRD
jgi:hypothetical protein